MTAPQLVREYNRRRLRWLSLPLLERRGIVHGFTLRTGGTSRGKFASLNFTTRQGDQAERVRENWRRLEEAGGLRPGAWSLVSQVHGSTVALDRSGRPFCLHRRRRPAADAVVSRRPGAVLGVLTADCLPVIVASPGGAVVGVVHAGWKGTLEGVIGTTVRMVEAEAGISAAECAAAVGPAIGRCCYQVGEEIHRLFSERWGARAVRRMFTRADPWRLDLQGAARFQLLEAGLKARNIGAVPLCTVCRKDLFFSHRRDGERTGRMLCFARVPRRLGAA